MTIRSLSLSDWLILARHKVTGLQEHVVGSDVSDLSLALRKALVGQLLPLRERQHSWVAIKDQRLMGLISTQPRSSPQVWQVAHLFLSKEGKDLTPSLFHKLTEGAIQHSIERLFLRLPQDSPLIQVALDSGFKLYLVERLYRWLEPRSNHSQESQAIPGIWCPKNRQDDHAIFQLYCTLTPATVRQAEGLVYAEWSQAKEKVASYQESVWKQAGQVRGWARARPWWDGVLMESLFYPGDEAALMTWLENHIHAGRPVYIITHSYQTQVQRLVEAEGFRPVAEHSLFLKRLLVRVAQTRLMPMRA